MTPQARVEAAIDVLDRILEGHSAEKTLTTWARKNRYAGSKDRAALRDLVYDALRQKRSSAHMGGSLSGRGLMLGQLHLQGVDPKSVFTGQGYAPTPLSDAEASHQAALETAPDAVRFDCQDWLFPLLQSALDQQAALVLETMRTRAPVFLRSNDIKGTRDNAIKALAEEDIQAERHPLSQTAIQVTENARRVHLSKAYQTGLVELQDAASQAVADALGAHILQGSVLDYCAGGGGKALALAAKGLQLTAHDAVPERMKDLPDRAARAGTPVTIETAPSEMFDAVLCDAPCSGSGAWRRQPEAKWRLNSDDLQSLMATQDDILDQAIQNVRPGGLLAYATCSLFDEENGHRIDAFCLRHQGWEPIQKRQFTPLEGGDGFFIAILRRSDT